MTPVHYVTPVPPALVFRRIFFQRVTPAFILMPTNDCKTTQQTDRKYTPHLAHRIGTACPQIVEGGPSGRTYRMPEGKVQVRGRVTHAGSRTLPGREE